MIQENPASAGFSFWARPQPRPAFFSGRAAGHATSTPAIADWPPVRTGARMRLQGKLVEKYDIGWTNGVTRMLLQ